MKKNFRILAMFVFLILLVSQTRSQTRVQAKQAAGNYYYYPEIDTWYDIASRRFIYFESGRWIFSRELSGKDSNYDVNNGYKILVDETRPYVHANRYRDRYINYYTAYHNNANNTAGLARATVYQNNERRQPAYDAHGRIDESRIRDRQPMQTNRPSPQRVLKNEEPSVNPTQQERRRIENTKPVENRSKETNGQGKVGPEINEEPTPIIERKPFEPVKIQPAEKTDHSPVENGKTDIRVKEESRTHIEPIKKDPPPLPVKKEETIAPVKMPEPVKKDPVKTDTVPVMNRNRVPIAPGGSREAQYSEKYKKPVG